MPSENTPHQTTPQATVKHSLTVQTPIILAACLMAVIALCPSMARAEISQLVLPDDIRSFAPFCATRWQEDKDLNLQNKKVPLYFIVSVMYGMPPLTIVTVDEEFLGVVASGRTRGWVCWDATTPSVNACVPGKACS